MHLPFPVVADDGSSLPAELPEHFLHALWQRRQFNEQKLKTTTGIPVKIFQTGRYNRYNKGPDFRLGIVQLGSEVVTGDIEMHLVSADWNHHGHEMDTEYNRVVLHVVLSEDNQTGQLRRPDGTVLPELVLMPFLDSGLRSLLHEYRLRENGAFPCSEHWKNVPTSIIRPYLSELAAERLSGRKYALCNDADEGKSWDDILVDRVFAAMGYTANKEPMLTLASRVDPTLLRSLSIIHDREALLFGAAGLIPDLKQLKNTDRSTANYVVGLQERFRVLENLCRLKKMSSADWHYRGLRPTNFPDRRLAQLARLFEPGRLLQAQPINALVQALAANKPLKALAQLMEIGTDPFWLHHVHLRNTSESVSFSIGKSRRETIIINAILPVISAWAQKNDYAAIERRTEEVSRKISAVSDRITVAYEHEGFKPRSIWECQGLHHLSRTRCATAGCLTCKVGKFILGTISP